MKKSKLREVEHLPKVTQQKRSRTGIQVQIWLESSCRSDFPGCLRDRSSLTWPGSGKAETGPGLGMPHPVFFPTKRHGSLEAWWAEGRDEGSD